MIEMYWCGMVKLSISFNPFRPKAFVLMRAVAVGEEALRQFHG